MIRHRVLGVLDCAVGLGLLALIWGTLPTRWLPVDAGGTGLALALIVAGVSLVLRKPWADRMGRIVGAIALAVGSLLATALAITAAHLAGIYGPVGRGGAIILALVAALIVPYLIGLPAAQVWLLRRKEPSA